MVHNSSPEFEPVRLELEQVRLAFLRLLNDIPERDWDRRFPNEGWTPRQEMAHVTQIIQLMTVGIDRARSGRRRSVLNIVPDRVRLWANGHIIVPLTYRLVTRAFITNAYEQSHQTLLSLLRDLPEPSWSQGAYYPREYLTIREMAHRPAKHFREHEAHLRHLLKLETPAEPPGRETI